MAIPTKLLIVDSFGHLRERLTAYLQHQPWQTFCVSEVERAIIIAQEERPAVAVLNHAPPALDGHALCRRLRVDRCCAEIGVLVVGPSAEEEEQLRAFEAGASDYSVAPVHLRLLLERLKALLRRRDRATLSAVVEHLGVQIDRAGRICTVMGARVPVTQTELRLLECLLRSPGRVFSRSQLATAVLPDAKPGREGAIDSHIKCLRRKLGASRELIEAVRSVGYRCRQQQPPPARAVP